ncbi:echinoderm microtubule-associated protein-like CG42247 isoform X1 [Cloeon dipterum]|uniref:echinoderm microtubule-associated protein-like CG42247 isoform X1 n=2 Tax=Cloeon dipterum TaxID=197152 RepID=UPI0032202DF4
MSDASPQEPGADEAEPTASSSPRKAAVARAKSAVDLAASAAANSDSEPEAGDAGPDESRTTYWGYTKSRMDDDPPVQFPGKAAGKEAPEAPPPAASAKRPVNNLSYWRARKVIFYKNGDPYFPGVEFRFKPTRDILSMESLLDKVSLRIDLPSGARYIFSTAGDRLTSLEQLEDGGSYVVSSYKIFKAAPYGKKKAGNFYSTPNSPEMAKPMIAVGHGNWRSNKKSMNSSVPNAGAKGSSGRIIRIVNGHDHSVQCRVLLNLRTTQPFEEVLDDLGQVLKMGGAKRMFTLGGQEVRSFSQLRNEYAEVDTFYLNNSSRRSRTPSGGPTMTGSNMYLYDEYDPPPRKPALSARNPTRQRVLSEPDLRHSSMGNHDSSIDYDVTEVGSGKEPARVVIKGNKKVFFPPMHQKIFDPTPPDKRMQLSWVYGYRGFDSKKNLWVLPSGEIMYYVAAVAVLYDKDEESQRHYTGHTEDIVCMDLHPSREMVASGQKAGRNRKTQAHVRIWSPETLLTLYVFGMGEFSVEVSAVAFSQLNGGSYALAVDGGRERILSVWQWQWGHLLGKVATLQDELSGAQFHPLDDNLVITYGKSHLAFWTRRKDGFFERTDLIKPPSPTNIVCLQFEPDGDVVTADSDGFITIYSIDSEGSYFVRLEFEAHARGIGSLVMLSEGTLLSGGEKDRRLVAWDSMQNYKKIAETKLLESAGGIRTIYPQRPGRNDGNVYIGTIKNNILEGSLQRRFNQLVFGHHKLLVGLATHPDEEMFATAGQDKCIALWRRNGLIWSTQTQMECVSICFHPDGGVLAAGTGDGHLLVINSENGNPISRFRVCGSSLNCVAFSPIGDIIAIGSQNGSVYLFRVSRDGFSYKKYNKIKGNYPLACMDWSVDSNYLQTVTTEFDLIYWDVKTMTCGKSPTAMKDVKWFTQTCTLGYSMAGIWNNRFYPMRNTISTSHRSSNHDMLIVGDTDGHLRLFRYPCISPRAEYNEVKGQSNTLTTARFFSLDQSVVTVGGSDASLMLWDLVEE